MKYDFDTTNTLRGFCQKFIICPNQWLKYNISVNLNWNCIKYERQNLNNLPDQSGVYAFVAKPCVANLDECNYLLYIGKAQDQTLKIRGSQYLS